VSGVRTIKQKVVVSASPPEVYEALTNARKLAAFTGAAATGAARIGGAFTAWDGYITGVHRKLVKGKQIVQDWRTTEWPDGAVDSRLELTLKKVRGGTEISMVHSCVPSEQADSYRTGWTDYYWKPLKQYFSIQR
jgi:activator of HSP90 ATPase